MSVPISADISKSSNLDSVSSSIFELEKISLIPDLIDTELFLALI